METKNYYKTGIIQGKPKNAKLLEQYMQSIIKTIKSEIEIRFSKYKDSLYISYKYNPEKRIFNIFVTIFFQYNYNYKTENITYLITVGEEYPEKPPKVFCLTDFHEKLDIFDMKNIQKNLIEQWKPNNTVYDLITELMTFSDSLAFQAEHKLLPNIGEYHYNSYIYDINDFLLNKNNKFFRVYYFSNHEKSNDINNNERYMIITKNTVLFFSNKNPKFKNQCIMEYKFELTCIDSLKRFPLNKYPNFIFFEFVWNNHSNYLHKFVFGTKANKNIVNNINDIIYERKKFLSKNFKYVEKFNDNDVETLEKKINIKEEYLEIFFSKNLYYKIHKLYRNIINIFNSMNDEGYKKYVDKLQIFIAKFEQAKKENQNI